MQSTFSESLPYFSFLLDHFVDPFSVRTKIVSQPKDVSLDGWQQDEVFFPCSAVYDSSTPVNIKWSFNGIQIDPTAPQYVIETSVKAFKLKYHEITIRLKKMLSLYNTRLHVNCVTVVCFKICSLLMLCL